MSEPAGTEVVTLYAQVMYELAPPNKCMVCHTNMTNCDHTQGMVCNKHCRDVCEGVIDIMSRANENIALDFHKYNRQISDLRLKGKQ